MARHGCLDIQAQVERISPSPSMQHSVLSLGRYSLQFVGINFDGLLRNFESAAPTMSMVMAELTHSQINFLMTFRETRATAIGRKKSFAW